MRGRKPDPKAKQRGTARHRKDTEIVPLEYSDAISPAAALQIPPPKVLPATAAVKRLWRDILQEVARHELRVGDLPLVESVCVAAYRKGQAGADVKKNGIWLEQVLFCNEETGEAVVRRVKNPMLKEERDQAMLHDRLCQRLGLSPESRIRLNLMQVAGLTLGAQLGKELDAAVKERLARVDVIDGQYVEIPDEQ